MNKRAISIYCISFFLPILIIFIGLFPSRIFPFGDEGFMIWDLEMHIVAFLSYFKSLFVSNNDIFYTFSRFGGSQMIDFSAYYNLLSPLNFLLFLFPDEYLQVGVQFLTILRFGLCGVTFAYFLNKEFGVRKINILFAVTYALCGYNIMNYMNLFLYDGIILLPIIIKGVTDIVKNNKSILYIAALTISIICHSFASYIIIVFSTFFFIYYLYLNKSKFDYFSRIKTYIVSNCISVGMTAWLLLPAIINSKYYKYSFFDDSVFSRFFDIRADFISILSKFFTKNASINNFILEQSPFIFIGILFFILIIMFFFNQNIDKKNRITTGLFFTFLICSFSFNFLFTFWNMGVENPLGTIFRFGFVFEFLAIYIAYISYINLEYIQKKQLFFVALIFSLITGIVYLQHFEFVNNTFILIDYIWGVTILSLIFLFYEKSKYRNIIVGILVFGQIVNLAFNTEFAFSSQREFAVSQKFSKYTNYYKFFDKVLNFIQNSDNSFYRIDTKDVYYKDDYNYRYNNYGMLYKYNAVSTHAACGNRKTATFYNKIGYPIAMENFIIFYEDGMTNFPLSFMGVKYIISSKDDLKYPYTKIYSETEEDTTLFIYKNELALPTGLIANKNIITDDLSDFEFDDYQNKLLKSISDENYGNPYKYKDISFNNTDYRIESEKNEKITTNDNVYLFLFRGDMSQKIKILIKNKQNSIKYFYEPILCFFKEFFYLGDNYKNHTLNITFSCLKPFSEEFLASQKLWLVYENLEILKKYFDKIRENSCNIEKITSSHIICKCNVKEDDKVLFFTIPADNGWQAKIDGKKVPVLKAYDTFIALPITKGNHIISLKFIPPGFYAGVIIAIISLILFIYNIAIQRRL